MQPTNGSFRCNDPSLEIRSSINLLGSSLDPVSGITFFIA
jgi:hypothetical protein